MTDEGQKIRVAEDGWIPVGCAPEQQRAVDLLKALAVTLGDAESVRAILIGGEMLAPVGDLGVSQPADIPRKR